jgi:hypothetical protein
MKTFFDASAKSEMIARLDKLTPTTKPLWGKMNSSQMLAHNVAVMESATDAAPPRKQMFIGKVFMLFMKKQFTNDKPHGKNSPTSPDFLMATEKDFTAEKQRLIEIITKFHEGGHAKVTKQPSVFWGHCTPEEWGIGMYKHMDHHFQQFGI